MIYVFDKLEYFDESKIRKLIEILPKQRKDKAASYRFFKDRRLSSLAYLLFVYALIKEGRLEKEIIHLPEFIIGENGKPYSEDIGGIEFNLSHCDEAVACGISDVPIGVDVQEMNTCADEDIMKLVLSEAEINDIISQSDRNKRFSKYWAVKESYYKCLGSGIKDDMNTVSFAECTEGSFIKDSFAFRVYETEDYYISVCEKRTDSFLDEIFFVTPDELYDIINRIPLQSEKSV